MEIGRLAGKGPVLLYLGENVSDWSYRLPGLACRRCICYTETHGFDELEQKVATGIEILFPDGLRIDHFQGPPLGQCK